MARRLMVLATPLALLAGGWLIFYVLKVPPEVDECALGPAKCVDGYREGLGTYATLAAIVIGVLIARTSPTTRTRIALAAAAWLTALYNLDNDALVPHALIALGLMVFGGEVVLLLSAIATLAFPKPKIPQLIYLWTSLLLLLPAAVGYPASEGTAGLCL